MELWALAQLSFYCHNSHLEVWYGMWGKASQGIATLSALAEAGDSPRWCMVIWPWRVGHPNVPLGNPWATPSSEISQKHFSMERGHVEYHHEA